MNVTYSFLIICCGHRSLPLSSVSSCLSLKDYLSPNPSANPCFSESAPKQSIHIQYSYMLSFECASMSLIAHKSGPIHALTHCLTRRGHLVHYLEPHCLVSSSEEDPVIYTASFSDSVTVSTVSALNYQWFCVTATNSSVSHIPVIDWGLNC